MKNKIIYSLILLLVLSLLVFLFNKPNVNNVSVEKFDELKNSEDVFIINTHTPYIGEIEDTDLIIEDWQNVALYENELPQDKNTKILVYCRSGSMSTSASQQLIDLGYKNVYNLEGGMNAWQASGKEIYEKG